AIKQIRFKGYTLSLPVLPGSTPETDEISCDLLKNFHKSTTKLIKYCLQRIVIFNLNTFRRKFAAAEPTE
ncbi:MAG: hypothetical protein ACOC59_02260, partial [Bacteroidota bacterium]